MLVSGVSENSNVRRRERVWKRSCDVLHFKEHAMECRLLFQHTVTQGSDCHSTESQRLKVLLECICCSSIIHPTLPLRLQSVLLFKKHGTSFLIAE